MKIKNTLLVITVVAAVLFGASVQAGGTKTTTPPSKGPPFKKAKPVKPVERPKPPKPLIPTQYSGRALGAGLSNTVNGAVFIFADTGSLPRCGGAIDLTAGATNIDVLSIGGAHVSTVGVGGVSTSTAEVSNFLFVLVEAGITNQIAFSSASAQARAEAGSNGLVLTASSQITGLTVNGVAVAITGEINQMLAIPGGSLVLNAQLACTNKVGQISVAAIFLMLTNGIQGTIAFAEADIKAGSAIPPAVRACDKVTGGGFILGTPSGGHGSFAVGGGIRRGAFWGHLNYIDHDTGMHVQATAVTGYTVIDAVTRKIDYTVDIDGASGTASVMVADNGEPGRNDIFDITLSTGYHAGGDLGGAGSGGGNIQLHKCPP